MYKANSKNLVQNRAYSDTRKVFFVVTNINHLLLVLLLLLLLLLLLRRRTVRDERRWVTERERRHLRGGHTAAHGRVIRRSARVQCQLTRRGDHVT